MATFSRILLTITTTGLALVPFAGTAEIRGIEQDMTAEEFSAAGLNRLTPEELRVLNAWLATRDDENPPEIHPQVTLEAPETATTDPEADANFGLSDSQIQAAKPKSDQQARIRTRIDGDFSGWTGKTRFKLQNGQVWQQRSGASYYYRAEDPEVEVFRGRFGFYLMKVMETRRTIGVKRIE